MSDSARALIEALEVGHSFRSNVTGKTIIRTPHGFVVFDRGVHLDRDDLAEALMLIETQAPPAQAHIEENTTVGNTSAPTEIRLSHAMSRYNAILKERDELTRRVEFLEYQLLHKP